MPIDTPRISPLIAWGFRHYVRRYLQNHLSSLRIAKGTVPNLPRERAVICFVNHPSWWDPLIAMTINERLFEGRTFYAPMDARALKAYPVFRKLGYFDIDMRSPEGARRFLGISRQVLRDHGNALWLTPGGRFEDVRRATEFQPGLAHLAVHIAGVTLLPMALELTFWEERTPEALVEFGAPIVSGGERTKTEWRELLESRLSQAQQSLGIKAMERNPDSFESLVSGSAGIGGFYDWVRWGRSVGSGVAYHSRHRDSVDRESVG